MVAAGRALIIYTFIFVLIGTKAEPRGSVSVAVSLVLYPLFCLLSVLFNIGAGVLAPNI